MSKIFVKCLNALLVLMCITVFISGCKKDDTPTFLYKSNVNAVPTGIEYSDYNEYTPDYPSIFLDNNGNAVIICQHRGAELDTITQRISYNMGANIYEETHESAPPLSMTVYNGDFSQPIDITDFKKLVDNITLLLSPLKISALTDDTYAALIYYNNNDPNNYDPNDDHFYIITFDKSGQKQLIKTQPLGLRLSYSTDLIAYDDSTLLFLTNGELSGMVIHSDGTADLLEIDFDTTQLYKLDMLEDGEGTVYLCYGERKNSTTQ